MKTKFFLAAIIFSSVFTATSCTDEDDADVTKPVILLVEPEDGDSLKIGSTICLEMDLSDDVMLASYKIDIHNNFDGHAHSSLAATKAETAFSYSNFWSVEGKRNTTVHHHEIAIPQGVTEGKYHFMVYCTDAAGNESYVVRNVILSNVCTEHEEEE